MRKENILRNIYGPVGIYEKSRNEELYRLHGKPNILTYSKCKRLLLGWSEHIWRATGDAIKNNRII